jgi:hypothetical protein
LKKSAAGLLNGYSAHDLAQATRRQDVNSQASNANMYDDSEIRTRPEKT